MKHYRITLWGYGADMHMCRVTDEQFNYWKDIKERVHDYESEEDDEQANEIWESFFSWDLETNQNVPEEAKFGFDSYHDFGDIFLQRWGVYQDGGNVVIEEVDSDQYSAKQIAMVMESKLDDVLNEETFGPVRWGEYDEVYPMNMDGNIMYIHAAEKGTFFEAVFSSEKEFDATKLEFEMEDIDGNYVISGVFYDGEQVYNDGGDTRGKSTDVYFIKDGVSK